MLIGVLLAINIIVCLGLIGVVLLQRSEGGALGMGGGGSGSFMTARGAGDLLTRITWILFSIFLVISLALALLTGRANTGGSVADQVKGLDTKSLNAAPLPTAPVPGSLNSLPTGQPSNAQPGAITAPAPQLNTPAPAAQPSLLAPAETAKKPVTAPKAAPKAAAQAPAQTAAKPAEATPAPTVAAPAADQPKQ
jgi:preprotein translocase subunit SecG